MRYEMTKGQAEHMIELVERCESEEAKALGIKVIGVNIGDGKFYDKGILYRIRDNGGFVMQTEPLTMEDHIVVVPNSGAALLPDNSIGDKSYTGMVNATAREITGNRL